MAMIEFLPLAPACAAGLLLGASFFGGLWWTVRRGVSAKRPALWFLGSVVLRMSIVLVGFYLVSSGDWKRLLACLLGFVTARVLVTSLASTSIGHQDLPAKWKAHAP
jgi:F1F0 ATPase subunit 2